MRFDENPIWKQIENFRFDFENYNGKFPEKLARTGNWGPDFTREVVEEYKKFLFLAATEIFTIIPPPTVDLAWKIHSENYPSSWKSLCTHVIQCKLKRKVPDSEDDIHSKIDSLYRETVIIYSNTFVTYPPADIWPPGDEWLYGYLIFPVPINGIPIKIKEAKIMLPLFIITGIVGLHLQSVWGVFGFWGAIAGSTIISRLINSFFGVKTKHPSPKDGMGDPVYE